MITFSPSGHINKSVGSSFTLNCSVVFTANVSSQNMPYPTIEWSYSDTTRSTNTSSLPSDVTAADVIRIGNTYISSLQFSALVESHAGIYTCLVGGNKLLLNSTAISTSKKTYCILIIIVHLMSIKIDIQYQFSMQFLFRSRSLMAMVHRQLESITCSLVALAM